MTLKAVQYHPDYCDVAKKDAEENGWFPWRWDSSHGLSIIDDQGKRHKIGDFPSASEASAEGLRIEKNGYKDLK